MIFIQNEKCFSWSIIHWTIYQNTGTKYYEYFKCLSRNALQPRIHIIILMIFQYHKHIIVKENEYNDCVPFRTFSPLTMTISFYLSIILCCESCVTLYLTFKKSDRYKCYIRCHNVVFL